MRGVASRHHAGALCQLGTSTVLARSVLAQAGIPRVSALASRLLIAPAMHVRRPAAKATEVAIVSLNPETLDGLQSYLSAAGVTARCTRDIDDCSRCAAPETRAFVVFPDDFAWESVVAAMAELTASRPRALPVLVTAHPNRFAELMASTNVLVVPRPVWGWTILDAIRAHLDGEVPSKPAPGA